ncbi:DNA topoisomerase IB [Luteimonas cucumeris]|uniref:DNA topoisomerase IB n=1 Tax=Luteimonas cucumeris TaxID=985012 RepID=A0A562KWJ2_9GAMM|nr:DNA topoisomerase IB [Luteimonas cucumeris]TWH99734.1 DNA topoisomerase IB [Luteimonas cucumeris]
MTRDDDATPADAAAHTAGQAGLVYVSDAMPGIGRRRAGKGFVYRRASGRPVRDAATLSRIRQLAIPPAYTDVWICAVPNGHLQATGRDARGRKQYRYHPQWNQMRGDGKFDRIVAFATALPRLRRAVRRDLKLPGLPREKVLAIVVATMATTLMRVGNDAYARNNGSFGLTTLRNRHVAFLHGGRARLSFRGKSGQLHEVELDDARLVKLVRACQQLPGQALFQYLDDEGRRQRVDSGRVNEYLRATMGDDFTAKDFRTWGGTLLAFQMLAATPLPQALRGDQPSEATLATTQNRVIAAVAKSLGNTVAVCRKAYIDPSLFAGWRDGSLQRAAGAARGARQWEQAALRFLKRSHRAAR